MKVAALRRYPVKSMLGESVDAIEVTAAGLEGDRRWAVIEEATGLVASAKQPRKWARLLQCHAVPHGDTHVEISLPDGTSVVSDAAGVDEVLSAFAGRRVTLSATPPAQPNLERLWPDVDGLAPPDVIQRAGAVTSMASAAGGTFFDYAPLHIVTTSALRTLRQDRVGVAFEATRFRPNLVLETDDDGFVENTWPGQRLCFDSGVVLEVLTATPRCAVPSLSHGELAADLDVLRGVVAANRITVGNGRFACVGVYAAVATDGSLRVGESAHVSLDHTSPGV